MSLARAAEVSAGSYSPPRRLLHGSRGGDRVSQRQGGYVIVEDDTFSYFPTHEVHQQPRLRARGTARITSFDDNEWLVRLLADALDLPPPLACLLHEISPSYCKSAHGTHSGAHQRLNAN